MHALPPWGVAGKATLADGPQIPSSVSHADELRQVHAEFGTLFALKITIFFTELLSVLLTPCILFFTLPPCAGAIIDFFREFSVHVDGVGYVCSFAVFDFRRHGKPKSAKEGGEGRFRTTENKMEKSFLHFKATHPDWQPDPASSVFLDRLRDQYSGSIYATPSRGYGVRAGLEDAKLRERSRSYDRAWARSSHLLRGKLAGVGEEEEEEEEEEGEGEGDEVKDAEEDGMEEEDEGWNKRVGGRDGDGDGEGDKGDEGFLRDVGMVGLLQQVLNR